MANYRVEFIINPNEYFSLKDDYGTFNKVTLPPNNKASKIKSTDDFSNMKSINIPNKGDIPFILGASPLGGKDLLRDSYNGYMSNQITKKVIGISGAEYGDIVDENGKHNFKIRLDVSGFENLSIFFDEAAGQYASSIQISGRTDDFRNVPYTNRDTIFTYTNSRGDGIIEVTFLSWNKPYYPPRFTCMSLGMHLTFDKFNGLVSFLRGSQSMQDNKLPRYGAVSQYGNVKINDYAGTLAFFIEKKLIGKNISNNNKIKLYMDDEVVGEYIFNEYTQKYESQYEVELNDDIVQWNNVLLEDYYADGRDYTALDLYNVLKSMYAANYEDLSNEMITHLNTIKIKYLEFKSGTLFEKWNEFCALTQTLVYKNSKGQIVVRRLE